MPRVPAIALKRSSTRCRRRRAMAEMGIGYGSECHLLRYLGRHRDELNRRVSAVTGATSISWLDSPYDPEKTWLDGEWKGLDFLPANEQAKKVWPTYWPQTGNQPNWDAVGR